MLCAEGAHPLPHPPPHFGLAAVHYSKHKVLPHHPSQSFLHSYSTIAIPIIVFSWF